MDILVLVCSEVFLRRVLPALYVCSGFTKIHIASKNKSIANIDIRYHDKLGKWFDSYSNGINSLCSNFVYISLPNHLHFFWGKRSLLAGLNIIIEKPATLQFSETMQLIQLSKHKELFIAESVVWPFHPNIEILKNNLKLFQNNPTQINASFTVPSFKSDNFRNYKRYGGGAFNDMSAYAVSIGRVLFCQKPISIICKKLSYSESEEIDTGFELEMDYGGGKFFKGKFGFDLEYKNNLEIFGSNFNFELSRVFSPPPDTEVNLTYKLNEVQSNERTKGDVYYNFFNLILTSYDSKDWSVWSDLIIEDASLTEMVKLKVFSN